LELLIRRSSFILYSTFVYELSERRKLLPQPTRPESSPSKEQNMSAAIKVELLSICAAFAFAAAVLAVVW